MKRADRRGKRLLSRRQLYAVDDCAIISHYSLRLRSASKKKKRVAVAKTSRPEAMMFHTDFSAKRNNVRTQILFYFLLLFSAIEPDRRRLDDLFRSQKTITAGCAAFPFTTTTRNFRNWSLVDLLLYPTSSLTIFFIIDYVNYCLPIWFQKLLDYFQ